MKARLSAAAAVVAAALAWWAAPTPARAAEPNWPDTLILATASPGGTYHVYGTGLARMLTRVLGVPVAAGSLRLTGSEVEGKPGEELGGDRAGLRRTEPGSSPGLSKVPMVGLGRRSPA